MSASRIDPVSLEIYRHLFAAIPEEMGSVLRATSFSPNIKERLDFSCALTGEDGGMAAQASHIPVHLGAVHVTGRTLLAEVPMAPGDVICVNDPWRGGTHLPDITLFAPVFGKERTRPIFGSLVRAHHADVGGATPGSMGQARDVFGEGLIIPPVRLVRAGELQPDVLAFILANTRTPDERRGDLLAQLAATAIGVRRMQELIAKDGEARICAATRALREHAARITRAMISRLKDGRFQAEASLDGPGTPTIRVAIEKAGDRMRVDFAGTDPAFGEPFNANEAITASAVFYVVRLLVSGDIPTNSGCLDPIEIDIPFGSFLNAPRPSAVAGGNVETSQRIVDALFLALAAAAPDRLPACSQGTMNNLTVGSLGGEVPWTFYETIGGGVGGGPLGPGISGIQSHMTNTLNTPVEALERAFPVIVQRYEFRRNSGGLGHHPGGDGLVRAISLRTKARATVLAHRRLEGAPGLAGGGAGLPGCDTLVRAGVASPWPKERTQDLEPGDQIIIETPGGGGFGSATRTDQGE